MSASTNNSNIVEITESQWMEMNICDGHSPGGPGLPAQKVFDITSYCSKVQKRNGRLLMRFAVATMTIGQLVQFLELNSQGKPANWRHYVVQDILDIVHPGAYDEKFIRYHLSIDANFFDIELDTLIKLIVDHRPRP